MGEQDLMLSEIEGLHAKTVRILGENKIDTVRQLHETKPENLLIVQGIGEKSITTILNATHGDYVDLVEGKVEEIPPNPEYPMAQPYPGSVPEVIPEAPTEAIPEVIPEPDVLVEPFVPVIPELVSDTISDVPSDGGIVDYGFHINPTHFGRMDTLVVFLLDFANAVYGNGSGTKFSFNPLDSTQTLAQLKLKYPHVFTELKENDQV